MDDFLCFARTEKGREELLGGSRTLKHRPRQVLFLVGESVSVGELKEKLPTCQELENILEQLWEDGFIGQIKSTKPKSEPIVVAPVNMPSTPLEKARQLALQTLASLAGDQSPVYLEVKNADDPNAFAEAIAHGKRVLASVASSAQANTFEQSVLAILNPGSVEAAVPINGIASAKLRALEIITSLIGTRSPVYAKIESCTSRTEFMDALGAGKKVIAAVASSSHAQNFETEVLSLLEEH